MIGNTLTDLMTRKDFGSHGAFRTSSKKPMKQVEQLAVVRSGGKLLDGFILLNSTAGSWNGEDTPPVKLPRSISNLSHSIVPSPIAIGQRASKDRSECDKYDLMMKIDDLGV